MVSSCSGYKTIVERMEEDPNIINKNNAQQELLSLDLLKSYDADSVLLAKAIIDFMANIEIDKKALDIIYQDLIGLDLLDSSYEITLKDSQTYHEYHKKSQELGASMVSFPMKANIAKLKKLHKLANLEKYKFPQHLKILDLVDKIDKKYQAILLAYDKFKQIADILPKEKQIINDKIDDAIKDFPYRSGVEKTLALDSLLPKVLPLKSLKEVQDNILADNNFVSLKSEIKAIPNDGEQFLKLYEGDAMSPGLIAVMLKNIIKAAQDQIALIDDYFDPSKSNPTSQAEIDNIALVLDTWLGGHKLRDYSNTRGVKHAFIERKIKLDDLIGPPKGGAAPPPIGGGAKPVVAIRQYKKTIEDIKRKTLKASDIEFNNAFKKLYPFYDLNKLNALKAAVKDAGDAKNSRYDITAKRLLEALEPYTIIDIKNNLKKLVMNEYDFHQEVIKILKPILSEAIFNKVLAQKDDIILKRVKFIKDYLHNNDPSLKALGNSFVPLDGLKPKSDPALKSNLSKAEIKAKASRKAANAMIGDPSHAALEAIAINDEQDALKAQEDNLAKIIELTTQAFKAECKNVNTALLSTVQNSLTIDCDKITKDLETNLKKIGNDDLKHKIELDKAKKEAEVTILDVINDVDIAGGYEQDVIIDGMKYNILKGESHLQEVIKMISNKYLKVAIDVTLVPNTYAYDITKLIDDIINLINTVTHSIDKPVNYAQLLKDYEDEIYDKMPLTDIKILRSKIDKKSSDKKLANLHVVLAPQAYKNIMSSFDPPDELTLIDNKKKAALAHVNDKTVEGAGVFDWQRAFDRANNASDDKSSEDALIALAKFFKDVSLSHKYNTDINNLAIETAIDFSASFGLVGQLGVLANITKNDNGYKALKKIASIDPSKLAEVLIITDPTHASESMEELANAIPSSMRSMIFGKAGGDIDIVVNFRDLQTYLSNSLRELKKLIPSSMLLPKTAVNIEPIANSFNLLFYDPIDQLMKLKFDGSDDVTIAKEYARFSIDYANKFKRFKSVVGEDRLLAPKDKRIIIKLLNGYTDSSGTYHDGLKDKLSKATSTISIKDDLEVYILNFIK